MRVTIARKFGLLGALFTAGGIVAMAAFYWYIDRSEPDAGFMYLAAQLKTTGQEMLLYADDVIDEGVGRDRLWGAVQRFEQDLSSLEKGGPALRRGVPAAPEPVLDEIDSIKKLWPPVKVRVGVISDRSRHDPEAIAALASLRDDMTTLAVAADALSAAYDDHAITRRREMRTVLGCILGLDLVLLATGFWITRRHVLRPIALLAAGAGRVRAGDFATPVPVATGDELAALARSFNDMTQNLVRSMRELRESQDRLRQAEKIQATGELAGGVAHDFNNRLTAIIAESELLQSHLPEGTARERAAHIRDAAQHAAMLTRQLLAFGRKQQLQPQVIDLNELVSGVVERMRDKFEAVDVVVRLAPAIGTVEVDPAQLEQVMVNLLQNAREAMPAGGTLTVETRARGGEAHLGSGEWLEVSIRDTGPGIAPENLARIFDPFFSTRPLHTGLGLSTSLGIVSQSGGHLIADSQPGAGATFRVVLPRAVAPPPKARPMPTTSREVRRPRILIAEDEPDVRQLVHDILKSYGYEVIAVPTGDEAIRVVTERNVEVDLFLTDVVMPGLDGGETARRLVERAPSTRVLYMSGFADDLIAERGLLPPGTAFLQKPFTIRELLEEVRRILGR
jgi:signal transduction histidine kinase